MSWASAPVVPALDTATSSGNGLGLKDIFLPVSILCTIKIPVKKAGRKENKRDASILWATETEHRMGVCGESPLLIIQNPDKGSGISVFCVQCCNTKAYYDD